MSRIKDLIAYDYYGFMDETDKDIDPMEAPVGDLFDDDTYWSRNEESEETV
jgi:hypothetical protein